MVISIISPQPNTAKPFSVFHFSFTTTACHYPILESPF